VRFSADTRAVVASANAKVQTDYALNVTAQAKDSAVGLVDANRRDEAAKQLRERNAELKKMAVTYNNPAIASVVASNAKEADRLERDGLDNVARKSYRAENAQTLNQQTSGSYSR
jgi:Ca-activated chloride channel family protein